MAHLLGSRALEREQPAARSSRVSLWLQTNSHHVVAQRIRSRSLNWVHVLPSRLVYRPAFVLCYSQTGRSFRIIQSERNEHVDADRALVHFNKDDRFFYHQRVSPMDQVRVLTVDHSAIPEDGNDQLQSLLLALIAKRQGSLAVSHCTHGG
jgi:hypothetical protein